MNSTVEGSPSRGRLLRVAVATAATLAVLGGIFALTLSSNASTSPASSPVGEAFAAHLSNFASENTSSLAKDYFPNASLVWDGNTRTLGGTYQGNFTISRFYSALFSRITTFSVSNATYKVENIGGVTTVNGTFGLLGGGAQAQSLKGEVLATASYVQVNGRWLISSERWYFESLSLVRPLD